MVLNRFRWLLSGLFLLPVVSNGTFAGNDKAAPKSTKAGSHDKQLRQALDRLANIRPGVDSDQAFLKALNDVHELLNKMEPKVAPVPKLNSNAGTIAEIEHYQEKTSWTRKGNQAMLRHQVGTQVITVTGAITDGRLQVSEIRIQEGDRSSVYSSLDRVPANDRARIRGLLESIKDLR